MPQPLDKAALDTLFRSARTQNGWLDRPIPESLLREVYELAKWGPTSANSSPARFVFCRSADAKARLARLAGERNQPKITGAPVCVIIASDEAYYEALPRLFPMPHVAQLVEMHRSVPGLAASTAFRNSTLQGAYLMLAARSFGLDCGPMSGFFNEKVDAEFFSGTNYKSNFICSLGYGDAAKVFPRHPRRSFEEVCSLL